MSAIFLKKRKIKRTALSSSRAGFGLLEVIIAIFILVMGLSSCMALIGRTLNSSSVSSSRLVAANLAQEGIEVVRNIRDANFDTSGWDNWYSSIVNGDYMIQYDDSTLRPNTNAILSYDAASGLYSYALGSPTAFNYRRKITLTKISDVEVKVAADVTWTENNKSHELVVEDRLWNWRIR